MHNSFRYLVTTAVVVAAVAALAMRTPSEPSPADRTYVGQQTCTTSGCHAGEYGEGGSYKGVDHFKATMHQKIHQRPTPDNVVIDRLFREEKELKYWDNRIAAQGKDTLIIKLSKGENPNDYYIQLMFSNGGDSLPKMKVVYNYGGTGWLQRYLVKIGDNYFVAPFQYVLPGYRSRSDTGLFYFLDLNRWYTNDPNVPNGARFFDWNSNQFKAQSWDKNCSACHVNGFDVQKVTSSTDTAWYATWAGVLEGDSAIIDENISIGCESCHGPGSEHVASPTKENIFTFSTLPNTPEATDLKLDVCNQCHKRLVSKGGEHSFGYDEATRTPFMPGLRLKDFAKTGKRTWADGLTSTAHHQQGDEYEISLQYKQHLFNNGCSDCHLSHYNKEGLPFQLNQDWYAMEDGVGCLQCHGSPGKSAPPADDLLRQTEYKGKTVNAHTKHDQSQSACVNCHFTHTNTIAFTGTQEFTDHSFRVLSPKGTLDYFKSNRIEGMINSCAEACHRNGRGSRNRKPTDPIAPDWDTKDGNIYSYKEKSDSILADHLWQGYKEMYKEIMSVTTGGELREVWNATLEVVTPNPFNNAVRIDFNVAKAGDVSVEIYDAAGRLVKTLARGHQNVGRHTAIWTGVDDQGAPVLSGNYFVRLNAGIDFDSRKVVFLR